ncbi:RNA polymerase sigma factor SigZ [Prosthecobacter sp. SYSU 5D2]|uniref:RNA polymerase sigma factor SigZ n=1 Tax=Prosthecobacter sp. SYSU 5D2 TaxID=3134134 RepID=UPI0031FF380B
MTVTLEDIWSQFATRLRHFIRGRVADESAAEDILQNVFVKIQQRLGQLRGLEKLESWIFQITRNAIVDHHRQVKPAEPLDEETAPAEMLSSFRDDPEAITLLAAFRRMISELPETYREAIELTELQGLTQQELAERMGISLSGAKSRVQRGRALLKEMLLECCRFEFDRRGGIVECEPKKRASCKEC